MSRNEFDASHLCPAVGRDVFFTVYIGDVPVCPECHESVLLQPALLQEEEHTIIDEKVPQEVEESEGV